MRTYIRETLTVNGVAKCLVTNLYNKRSNTFIANGVFDRYFMEQNWDPGLRARHGKQSPSCLSTMTNKIGFCRSTYTCPKIRYLLFMTKAEKRILYSSILVTFGLKDHAQQAWSESRIHSTLTSATSIAQQFRMHPVMSI